MTRMEIVERLGREKRVETMVCNIARRPIDQDLHDLVQIVYLTLLTYDPEKIIDLYEHGEINFFLVRVIKTNLASPRSPYAAQVTRFRSRTSSIRPDFDQPADQ